jgi:U3 small nucleolar ribonucleoprotein protein IMP4
MLRRNARLRREYLYRKSLEGKQLKDYERKRKIQEALQEGRPVPTDLKAIAANVIQDAQFDDVENAGPPVSIDDEYASAGADDPRIMITTARDPSARLQQFAKELKLLVPNAQRINRGNTVIKELVSTARSSGVTDLMIVHEHRGEPDGLIICHLPYGPTAYFGLHGCVLRHDIRDEEMGTMSEAYPHLIFNKFETKLGNRVMDILKHLYPVPKADSQRIITFSNSNDFISFRHHVYEKDHEKKGEDSIALKEVGPRFEMRLYQIKLGTVDMLEAENEWVLRPYMNTAKKRKAL